MKLNFRLFIFIFLLISKNIFTKSVQEDTLLKTSVNEVVITGQINEKKSLNTVQKTIVIGKPILETNIFQNLSQVIETQSGFSVSHDNVLGDGLKIQGFGGQNVKILIDGSPVIGRLNGNIDLSQISLENISKIEIIEGPSSVIYGSDALAGTINLISNNKYKKLLNFSNRNFYESVGRYNNDLNLVINNKISKLNISFSRKYFDGWSENEKFTIFPKSNLADTSRYKKWKPKESYSFKIQESINKENIKIKLYFNGFNEKITNRGFPIRPYFENAFDDYYYTYRRDLGSNLNYNLNSFNINNLTSYNRYKRIKNTYYKDLTSLEQTMSADLSANDTTKFSQFISKFIFSNSKKRKYDYLFGIDIDRESSYGKRIKNSSQNQLNLSLFNTFEFSFKKLLIRPGVRLVYNNKYKAPIITSTHFLYKEKNLRYRFSLSQGFRSPSIKELFFEFNDINHDIIGNPNLNSENSINVQCGFSYNNQFLNNYYFLSFDFFHNRINNKIDLLPSLDVLGQYTYYNIDSVRNLGMNSKFEFSNSKFNSNLNISYIGLNTYEFSNEYNYQFTLSNIFTYKHNNGLNINLFYKYFGNKKQLYYDSNNILSENIISDYSIMDLSLNKNFMNEQIEFSVGLKNLMNNISLISINNNSVHSDNSSTMNIGYGRTFFAGINFKL